MNGREMIRGLALVVALLTGSPLWAQDGTDDEKGHKKDGKCACECREKRHQKILEKFDKDGDGKLSDAEKTAAKEAMEQRREARQKKILEKFDTNKDGTLSDEEKKALKEQLKERMKNRRHACDCKCHKGPWKRHHKGEKEEKS